LATHIAVWALALLVAPTLIPERQLLAEGLSTLAIVGMSTNLLLSTRARALERGLGGLDKLFVTHRTIGLTVALLVSAHFLLVPKSIGYVPSKPIGYTTIALLLLAIFIASAPRFPWRRLVPLRYQTWKLSHRFMGAMVALAVSHSLLAHTYVKGMPLLAGYVYGVATLGLLAWLYKELVFRHTAPFNNFRVELSRILNADTIEVTLSEPNRVPTRTAGQFAFVSFDGGPTREQHPFTISSGTLSDLRFSIKASGDFTDALLHGVPVGSAASVEGPYGAFDFRRGLSHQLWLAGGIGITPFLSMAADLDDGFTVTLIWSVRDACEAIYEEELALLAAAKSNLDFRVYSTSEQGHLDMGTVSLDGEPWAYSCFICGPVPMRQATQRQLKLRGVPRSHIYFEEFRLR